MKTEISVSVLDSNFAEIRETLRMLESLKIKYIHFDVMDGNFVPNLTFGAKIIKPLRPLTGLLFDTHLMINTPEKYIEDFLRAGSDIVTVHIESTEKMQDIINAVHSRGKKAGISIKPETPVSALSKWLPQINVVLVMSVEPGFGGQKFIEPVLEKVKKIKQVITRHKYKCLVEVDGGINTETVPLVCAAGADIFVAGNAIFGSPDPAKAIRDLQKAAKAGS